MKSIDVLSEIELPQGFTYPRQFKHILELGLIDLQPWYILEGAMLRQTMKGLASRYPIKPLIPFARRQDNDDIACWLLGAPDEVVIIHDFASPGWEERRMFHSFYEWFRSAIDDLIEFDT